MAQALDPLQPPIPQQALAARRTFLHHLEEGDAVGADKRSLRGQNGLQPFTDLGHVIRVSMSGR